MKQQKMIVLFSRVSDTADMMVFIIVFLIEILALAMEEHLNSMILNTEMRLHRVEKVVRQNTQTESKM